MHDLPAFIPSCITMSSQVLRTFPTSARTIFSIRWCVVSVGRSGDCAGDGEGEGDDRLEGVDCSEARRDMLLLSGCEVVEAEVDRWKVKSQQREGP